jgi:heme o synthase
VSRRTLERHEPAFAPARRRAGGSNLPEIVAAYVKLTKPRIVVLLLITTVPAMILAERGLPSLTLIAATLFGGILSAGGANAVNQYLDRDIDLIMARTRRRPIPSHRIEPSRALAFGVFLGLAGFAFLWLTVNLLSAVLATAAMAFYVFVYTMWLKRRSPQNIVIGGAAGAVPALVGWAAVTGRVGWAAVVMFDIVFLWTPPHFWALALRYQRDYAAARIPMLPVVAGEAETRRQIVLYSLVLVASTLVLSPVGHLGVVYVTAAVLLGARFLVLAVHLSRRRTPAAAMTLFRYSLVYLAVLFAAVAADVLIRFGL